MAEYLFFCPYFNVRSVRKQKKKGKKEKSENQSLCLEMNGPNRKAYDEVSSASTRLFPELELSQAMGFYILTVCIVSLQFTSD